MRRTIVIGDIHGCRSALDRLLQEVGAQDRDRIVSVGDVLNKGPDPVGVVQDLRRRGAELVCGNHEWSALCRRRDAALGLPIARAGDPRLAALSEADWAWLAAAPLWLDLEEGRGIAVHGGVAPFVTHLPPMASPLTYAAEDLAPYRHFLDVRFLAAATLTPIPFRTERVGDPFWAEVYDGRFGPIFFGHHPFSKRALPKTFAHATALDLGAVYGNRLAAAVLEDDRVRLVAVSAKGPLSGRER